MMDEHRKSSDIQLTQSVLKALDILEYLQQEGKPVLPTQIAKAIGVALGPPHTDCWRPSKAVAGW